VLSHVDDIADLGRAMLKVFAPAGVDISKATQFLDSLSGEGGHDVIAHCVSDVKAQLKAEEPPLKALVPAPWDHIRACDEAISQGDGLASFKALLHESKTPLRRE
jgi:hypothetical protein